MICSFSPYEGNEKYIFVSYSHKNSEKVAQILERLHAEGFRIWYDEGIEWGTEWPEAIASHITNCDVCMIFHSSESVVSPNCRQEIHFALKKNKNVLSVYLEDVELSEGLDMGLSPFQSTFYHQYEDKERFFERLINTAILQPCRDEQQDNSLNMQPEKDTAEQIIETPVAPVAHVISKKKKRLTAKQVIELKSNKRNFSDTKKITKTPVAKKEWLTAKNVILSFIVIVTFLIFLGLRSSPFEQVKRNAEKGDVYSQNRLGNMYYYGSDNVSQDYAEAAKWYLKAAEQGNVFSQFRIAYMYENAEGIKRNYTEALKWYLKAAEKGDSAAQNNLGVMYENGEGLKKANYTEAVKWYRKSAEQGDKFGQYNLGTMYEYGTGVKKNSAEAIRWYKLSAKQGHENAQKALKRLGKTY